MEAPNNKIQNGYLAGATTATQMPQIVGNYVRIKALNANTGNIYIGNSSVNIPAYGNTDNDIISGFELAPGDETGLMPISNLRHLYYICQNSTDGLTYIVISNTI